MNLNNAVTKEFNATVLMHIKKDNIKIQKCLHELYCHRWKSPGDMVPGGRKPTIYI